ncbi:MAG: serine hydrolase [Proteobacteria bacterium]|nr:serine hydrolase [Pseudomonadota bacterium]
MSRRDLSRILAALGLAALPAFAKAGTAERLFQVLTPPDGPPLACAGVIARLGDGRPLVEAAASLTARMGETRPFSLDRPFRVASVSKMITTSVVLPLAMRHGLDLDADASDALGFRLRHPAWPDVAITPRMLLSHTSGLRNGKSYPVPIGYRLAEAFTPGGRSYDDGVWFGPPEHRPGDWFAYADVNFALAAQIAERLSGQRFDLLMRQALFAPLDLDIGYNWSGVSQGRRDLAAAAVRRDATGAWSPQVDATVPPAPAVTLTRPAEAPELDVGDYRPGDNGFVFSPHGGLRLSLRDMDRLAQVFAARGRWIGREVIPLPALEAMETRAWTYDPDRPNGETDGGLLQAYGLGCEAPLGRPGPSGDSFFGVNNGDWRGHFGDAYGWITALFWNRRDGRTLVYAINGMPQEDRPHAATSCLTAPEEALIALAFRA